MVQRSKRQREPDNALLTQDSFQDVNSWQGQCQILKKYQITLREKLLGLAVRCFQTYGKLI